MYTTVQCWYMMERNHRESFINRCFKLIISFVIQIAKSSLHRYHKHLIFFLLLINEKKANWALQIQWDWRRIQHYHYTNDYHMKTSFSKQLIKSRYLYKCNRFGVEFFHFVNTFMASSSIKDMYCGVLLFWTGRIKWILIIAIFK